MHPALCFSRQNTASHLAFLSDPNPNHAFGSKLDGFVAEWQTAIDDRELSRSTPKHRRVRVQSLVESPPPVLDSPTLRRGAVALQAIVRGRAARCDIQARHHASSRVAAWWRAAVEARRYRRTRSQVVIVQSLLRGMLGREEVASRWLAVGRRLSKHKAATMIQVRYRMLLM